MANKIMEVTSLLGLNPYEEFKLKIFSDVFRFTDSEFQVFISKEWVKASSLLLADLIYGEEIIRLPYRPKSGDKYWTITGRDFGTTHIAWAESAMDYCRLKLGMVFRTKEEAHAKRDEIYQMLTGNGLEV